MQWIISIDIIEYIQMLYRYYALHYAVDHRRYHRIQADPIIPVNEYYYTHVDMGWLRLVGSLKVQVDHRRYHRIQAVQVSWEIHCIQILSPSTYYTHVSQDLYSGWEVLQEVSQEVLQGALQDLLQDLCSTGIIGGIIGCIIGSMHVLVDRYDRICMQSIISIDFMDFLQMLHRYYALHIDPMSL